MYVLLSHVHVEAKHEIALDEDGLDVERLCVHVLRDTCGAGAWQTMKDERKATRKRATCENAGRTRPRTKPPPWLGEVERELTCVCHGEAECERTGGCGSNHACG